ncbi:class I SAM-dependent methyltransferase [Microcoleus sp. F10-C6]|uniref:class I SAM-dependent methyltransferase n=1 Tax=unclassified Microcoleus TaxID=2642155 RepID=UPI002FD54120
MKPWLLIPGDWRRPGNKESFQLYWCEKSQLGCIHPLPELKKIASFYEIDEYYTHHADSRDSDSSSSISFLDKLRTHLAWRFDRGVDVTSQWWKQQFGTASYSILEIGCANGELMEELQADGHKVWGVEPDRQALVFAEQRGLNVFYGTAESLPPEVKSRQYDTIVMNHVLEHTIDPLLALRNAMNLLVDGGKLVMEVPNNSCIGLKSSGIAWMHLDVPRHLYFFTPHSFRAICEKVGFEIICTEFNGYYRQFANSWIDEERNIFNVFDSMECPGTVKPKENSKVQAWNLLLKTIFAADENKYDSIRVVAQKP